MVARFIIVYSPVPSRAVAMLRVWSFKRVLNGSLMHISNLQGNLLLQHWWMSRTKSHIDLKWRKKERAPLSTKIKGNEQNMEQVIQHGPDATQPDISLEELRRLCHDYKSSLSVSLSERERIQRATLDQAGETLWFKQRKCRLTASNFGIVARRRQSTPVGKLVKHLLYDTVWEAKSLQWGRDHEEDARLAYAQQRGINTTLTRSGLVIDSNHGWLACSPDDLVFDSMADHDEQHGLAEYKCPYSARDTTVKEACKKKDFMSTVNNGRVTLKRTHKYFYQVQGQMAICQRNWCDFVIWTPTSISVERIAFDPGFWANVLPKLELFFDRAILPELSSPRFPQGQPIRELPTPPWLICCLS